MFCFHDSLLKDIDYDDYAKFLTLKIDFCFWAQDWYDSKEFPETGLILVNFFDVSDFISEDRILKSDSIDGIELLGDNDLLIKVYDRDYFEMHIHAKSVEVEMLSE